ncbi:hypothetical protein [Kitasatospora cineracea]|uniref:hypothetical protein n=1 Tax=Kitasatospora cineracea TaxID=88074 RepID=UPI0011CDA925|nr:hypothetical protein [Kitasatospora cineracea]
MTRTTYGFSPSLLRDLCSATDATVADLADAARISTGELRCHLAGECGEPAPEVLLRLASALSALPGQLCSVTDERLASDTETTRSHWHTVGHHRPTLPWWSPPD